MAAATVQPAAAAAPAQRAATFTGTSCMYPVIYQ
jgi:hypothetical protein